MRTLAECFVSDGDRYYFDFGPCSTSKGYAQVDTGQDAWYFGIWANPSKLRIMSYTEGDILLKEAESPQEFEAEIRRIKAWHDEQGIPFKGIDPGFSDSLKARFEGLGLGDLLH